MSDSPTDAAAFACPLPVASDDKITLAHGEGGWLTRRLIETVIAPRLGCTAQNDAAVVAPTTDRIVITTDSFVVSPLRFPGGDIGRLAVIGTANDLTVSGAIPRWLSLALIIEEGFPIAELECVLASIAATAREVGVEIVTGDTKIVPRGAADGLYINTTGIGVLTDVPPPGPAAIEVGDHVIVSAPLARHGFAILSARENLGFEPPLKTDCADLGPLTNSLRTHTLLGTRESPVRAMRDATRGGLTAVLHEWAAACGHSITLDESQIPIRPEVEGVSQLLGIDPLHVANEGVMVLAVASDRSQQVVDALRAVSIGHDATVVGVVKPKSIVPVSIKRLLGREQPLDEPSEAMLPRIC